MKKIFEFRLLTILLIFIAVFFSLNINKADAVVPPTLDSVTIHSNNTNPSFIKNGETVAIEFSSQNHLQTPVVKINNTAVDVSQNGDDMHWIASEIIDESSNEGLINFTIDFNDLDSTPGEQVYLTTDGSTVTIDLTPPTIEILSPIQGVIYHENPPAISLNNNDAILCEYSINNTDWSFLDCGNPYFPVSVGLNQLYVRGTDNAGNVSDPVSTSFTYSTIPISLDKVTISSDNPNHMYAMPGNNVTLKFSTSESLQTPMVTLFGIDTEATQDGDDMHWIASRLIDGTENRNIGEFSINYKNIGGNEGLQENLTTDETIVHLIDLDSTAPTLDYVNISTTNSTTTIGRGQEFTFYIKANEGIVSPVVTINGNIVELQNSDPENRDWFTTIKVDQSYSEGPIKFSINFSDLAGNAGEEVTDESGSVVPINNIMVDFTPPTIEILSPTQDRTYNVTYPDISINYGDAISCEYSTDNTNWSSLDCITPSFPISEGLNQVYVRGTDSTGNVSDPISVSFVYYSTIDTPETCSDGILNQNETSVDTGGICDNSTITHFLRYLAGSHGTLSGQTSQTINDQENSSAVTAIAGSGYYFKNWSDGSTQNPRTDLNVTSDINVTANFDTEFSYQFSSDSVSIIDYGNRTKNNVIIPATVDGLPVTSIGNRAFEQHTEITSISIPSTVAYIGSTAFAQTSITSIVLPDNLITIGDNAFSGTKLLNLVIPDTVTSMGNYAFAGINTLTSVIIGTGITEIKNDVFLDDTSLVDITIPDTVTIIGPGAFSGNTSLKSIILPSNLLTIGILAFYNDTNLESITIPSKVTSIGNLSFYGNTSLVSVNIGSSVETIGVNAFGQNTSLSNLIFGSSIKSIGDSAFEGDRSLGSIVFPDSVISIGNFAFSGNTLLSNVSFNNNLHSIGISAFSGNAHLVFITLPESIDSIGLNAFAETSLTSAHFLGNAPEEMNVGSFGTFPELVIYYEPESSGFTNPWYSYETLSTQNAATCFDGIQNQDEMGIDTGGICSPTIISKPTISTDSAQTITSSSVILNGNISSTGGRNATARGFEYGLSQNYGTTTLESGSFDTGSFNVSITNLSCTKQYHFRSYAINSAGTSYGDDELFTTNNCFVINSSNYSSSGSSQIIIPKVKDNEIKGCLNGNKYNTISGKICNDNITVTNPVKNLRILKIGMKGDDVKKLQSFLNFNEYNCGVADGKFGSKTKFAVIAFQKAKFLSVDGIVGAKTMIFIN